MVEELSDVLAIMRSLFISMVTGLVGLGREDTLIVKSVLASKLMLDILNPILLLTTSDMYVWSLAPCTTSTVRGRSLKLSNYSGNVI